MHLSIICSRRGEKKGGRREPEREEGYSNKRSDANRFVESQNSIKHHRVVIKYKIVNKLWPIALVLGLKYPSI